MVLKSEQQQIRTLLIEAVTMLCKNGLRYRSKFSIEGLIGITLDDNEVLLVSMQETFRSDLGRFLKNGEHSEQHVPLNLSPAPPLSPASTPQAPSPAHIKQDQGDICTMGELNLSMKTDPLQNHDTCSNSPSSFSHKRSHEESRVPPLHEPPDDSESSNSQNFMQIASVPNRAHSSDDADEPPLKRANVDEDEEEEERDKSRNDVILVKEEAGDEVSDNDIDSVVPNSEPIQLPNLGQALGNLRANPSMLNFDGSLDMNAASSSSLLFSPPPGCSAWDPSTSLVPSSSDLTPTSSVITAALNTPSTPSTQSQVGAPPGLQLPPGVILVQQPGGLPTGIVYLRPKTGDAAAPGNLLSPPQPPANTVSMPKGLPPISSSVPLTQPANINLLSPSVPGIRSPFLMPKPVGGFPTSPTPLLSPKAPPNMNVSDLLAAKIAQQMGGITRQTATSTAPRKLTPLAPKKKPVLEFAPPSNRKYRFSCLECNYTTNRRYNIERHMRTHGNEGLITSDQVRYEEVGSASDDCITKDGTSEETPERSDGKVCLSPTILDCVKTELDVTKELDQTAENEARGDLGLDEVIIEETEGTVIQVEQNFLEGDSEDKLNS